MVPPCDRLPPRVLDTLLFGIAAIDLATLQADATLTGKL
jgi:hypothetical protein